MSKMETMERKKPRPRRSFTPEFKAEIVELCRRGDRSIGQVARDFDLTVRRENRSLKEDVEILKRATVFFAKETR
jgi:transposase